MWLLQAPEFGLQCIIEDDNYISLDKVPDATAYIIRSIHHTCTSVSRKSVPNAPQEYNYSDAQIHHSQQQVYHEEIANLTAKLTSCLTLVLYLLLFLDENKVIHCGGRICNASVSKLKVFPYLLP